MSHDFCYSPPPYSNLRVLSCPASTCSVSLEKLELGSAWEQVVVVVLATKWFDTILVLHWDRRNPYPDSSSGSRSRENFIVDILMSKEGLIVIFSLLDHTHYRWTWIPIQYQLLSCHCDKTPWPRPLKERRVGCGVTVPETSLLGWRTWQQAAVARAAARGSHLEPKTRSRESKLGIVRGS